MSAHHHPHSHAHGHGRAHGHGHAHGHAHGPVDTGDWRYGVALAINLAFVCIEFGYGLIANSTALMADAGHNLADVLGLAMAGGAAWLARRAAPSRRTYGFGKATILAALGNGVLLVFACGAIAMEAIRRLSAPIEPASTTIMVVAGIGFVVNIGTAALFLKGRKEDLNVRGAYLHMVADAAVSLGVVVVGLAMLMTGWSWIDPLVGLAIVVIILFGTWGLLRDSFDLAMDSAPAGIDVGEVRAALLALPGVEDVHDLHVWALSTTETALTAHLVHAPGGTVGLLAAAQGLARDRFGIGHVTVQLEEAAQPDCPTC